MRKKVPEGKFGLIIMESTTGILLNSNLDYLDSRNEEEVFLFDSILETEKFIKEVGQENTFFEVFNHDGDLVYQKHLEPIPHNSKIRKRWWQIWK